MFCPKCGSGDQHADSYCKRCGEWLPDVDALNKRGLFRKRTREEKIRKMRTLEALSAALSLLSAAIIFFVIWSGSSRPLLIVSGMFGVIVAVYQIVNFYLGHSLQRRVDQTREDGRAQMNVPAEQRPGRLSPADTTQLAQMQSVVENTTQLLDPVPRGAEKRDR